MSEPYFRAAKESEISVNGVVAQTPAYVSLISYDNKGRRCNTILAECQAAARDRNADAVLIARLLNEHFGYKEPK